MLCLTACWDAKELDDLYLVYGIGIDISEDNPEEFFVTIVAPTIHPEGEKTKIEISSQGSSMRNAQDNIQSKAARRITFNNTKVFLVGEDAARNGLEKHIDTMLRDPEGRGSIRLAINEGRAVDLLNMKLPHIPYISLYLVESLEQSYETTTIPNTSLRDFNHELYTDGIEPIVPFIRYGNKPTELLINNIALFQQDKMIGILEKEESKTLMKLRGKIYEGFFSIAYSHEEKNIENILSLRIIRGRNKITTEIKDNKLHIYNNISLTTNISEYTGAHRVFDDNAIKEIEEIANNTLKSSCEQLLLRLQKELKNDNIGYGRYVRVNHPEYFDDKRWNEQFSNAKIHVNTNIKVKMVGVVQ